MSFKVSIVLVSLLVVDDQNVFLLISNVFIQKYPEQWIYLKENEFLISFTVIADNLFLCSEDLYVRPILVP